MIFSLISLLCFILLQTIRFENTCGTWWPAISTCLMKTSNSEPFLLKSCRYHCGMLELGAQPLFAGPIRFDSHPNCFPQVTVISSITREWFQMDPFRLMGWWKRPQLTGSRSAMTCKAAPSSAVIWHHRFNRREPMLSLSAVSSYLKIRGPTSDCLQGYPCLHRPTPLLR
ncbi:hypothetical protein BV22DRAFT_567560 [Leucogyrophana mollusca]|uniref:Uncharacterized protein n=1 Tax=Leucogyrophana mollusca TaxID=85980 RepID=A0ACB8BEL4_9AGAM|nr:hypothetical protein BV22DRAFT_567560 [Leucogyrophana mollusca]